MARIQVPFAGAYNERTAKAVSAQNAINMYPEIRGASFIMRQRMGLKYNQAAAAGGPTRGSIEAYGLLFFVSNNTLYKMDTSENLTSLGTLSTYIGFVGMTDNGTDLFIVDGTDGYAYEYSTGTFTTVTDADFTALGATQCKFLDGRFIVNKPDTGEFYISSSYPTHAELTTSGAGWAALDFANAEADPDDIVTHEIAHQQIILFGSNSTEFWVNTGNADFPFERQPGGVIEWGCLAPWSVAKGDNTVIWLSRNREGHGHVVQATGFSPQVISTDAVEEKIATFTNPNDAYAFVHKEGRHLFYVLTFVSGNTTFVYDFTTKLWHERQSYDVGRLRIATHSYFNGKQYVGDALNGNIYTLDPSTYSDNGDVITRRIRTAHNNDNQDLLFCHELQIKFEQGVGLTTGQGSDPQCMIRWSDDEGHTWSNEHWRTIGKIGKYKNRTRIVRCGSYRNRVWEMTVTDPVNVTVTGAYGRFSKGTS